MKNLKSIVNQTAMNNQSATPKNSQVPREKHLQTLSKEDDLSIKIRDFRIYLALKRYSNRTIQNYISLLSSFFNYFPETDERSIGISEIETYNEEVILKKNYSASYQNQLISAVKAYYKRIHGMELRLEDIERPKLPKRIPTVLSPREVKKIIDSTNNLKHKAIISTIYSAGLRVGEACNLCISDIDSVRMVIHIRSAKGNKDRMVNLSEKLLILLRTYYVQYRPKKYLFEGWEHGKYSTRSVGQLLKKAVQRAKIRKHVTVHTRRHSFATHLVESGTDIHYIQRLLGHTNIKTTTIYIHIAKEKIASIRSPFDDL